MTRLLSYPPYLQHRCFPPPPNADSKLAESIAGAIQAEGFPEAARLDVSERFGIVCLRGSVTSFYLKQIAHEIVRAVAGVRLVINDLAIVPTPA